MSLHIRKEEVGVRVLLVGEGAVLRVTFIVLDLPIATQESYNTEFG